MRSSRTHQFHIFAVLTLGVSLLFMPRQSFAQG